MRPANLVTAVADVLAGIAISGYFVQQDFSLHQLSPVILLSLATVGLYGGGVVFNDVFDAELDRVERPERAIPRGIISVGEASALGVALLLAGVLSALFVNILCGMLAFSIAVMALVYDKWGKHQSLFGPLNMGVCRGLNLLLGMAVVSGRIDDLWYISFVPIVYIAAITMISRGEVHGGTKSPLYFAAFLYLAVIAAVVYFSLSGQMMIMALIILLLFAIMIFIPLTKAIQQPIGKNIGKAVKAGVIGLILLNASWAMAFGSPLLALLIILLLPLSLSLAKWFAVT